ncbi:MAG: NADP-dependent malic enzyme [Kordiimonadaceae bacterium]|jgi:malate dehydrogenase (oxaloacetate-decarboxylating)(NADP+)|nr:NADP-dependent malic enzyme [Kordiimonadaceae bacterium]MBT6135565.1 NADP-dependent malic enzyme [Kordiimonadaceae bacterium]MBT6466410.1 NADP-dependent malic enzyme [Kordiimonadaceae bacterium]MBT7544278.1 NADP-dependent malic enzyme [Kordiimonadaceae bacterium]MBT7605261.1 NADP-dependent malic enzyme [Kordiimonadaceae bacterium]
MSDNFKETSLRYHREPTPGKLGMVPTKPLANQRDLARAYSPGVAFACEAIVEDPSAVSEMTIRANLVGVITNGSAVLGLGNIGPLASKPVMEGKAVLFKKFAGINVFDIEIDQEDPDKLIEIIAALEPTFGAINLEDIKAPECFVVEKALRKRMKIPVFHDDQHGTAIVAGAAISNGLRVVGKELKDVKLVATGGGAASLACLDLLVSLGLRKENITLVDLEGVVFTDRKKDMNIYKDKYARDTTKRTLDDAMNGVDVFLGLSAPGILKPSMLKNMAKKPFILALANPTPEITPEEAKKIRPDAVIATGRSDYPNQVNNVLCFPFLFRGALDVGATEINDEMKKACVWAIANLAYRESSDEVADVYRGEDLKFGPDYIIPKPFDPRLILEVAPAVAEAAMLSGVATRPISDMDAYRKKIGNFIFKSNMLMQPIIEDAKKNPKRVIYAEGEDKNVLRAVQAAIDEKLIRATLIGRPDVINRRIEKLGLRLKENVDFEVINPHQDGRYKEFCNEYHKIVGRKGVSKEAARTIIRTNTTVIAAMSVKLGYQDAMICGTYGRFDFHIRHIIDIIGRKNEIQKISTLSVLILAQQTLFITDAFMDIDPTMEQIVETTLAAAKQIELFGIKPKVALLSHSNFGSSKAPSAVKMGKAVKILRERAPDLEVDGEMHADAALNESLRNGMIRDCALSGAANLLIFPTLDSANSALGLVKSIERGLLVGPILLGAGLPAHVVTPGVSARGILNMTAIAVKDAQKVEKENLPQLPL